MIARIEHRWGRRLSLTVPTLLTWGSGETAALMMDASSSGAFIRCQLCPPRWSRVEVAIESGRVAAWVVRVTVNGVGVEWWEFAPEPILALTRPERPLRAGRASTGIVSPAQVAPFAPPVH